MLLTEMSNVFFLSTSLTQYSEFAYLHIRCLKRYKGIWFKIDVSIRKLYLVGIHVREITDPIGEGRKKLD